MLGYFYGSQCIAHNAVYEVYCKHNTNSTTTIMKEIAMATTTKQTEQTITPKERIEIQRAVQRVVKKYKKTLQLLAKT